MADGPTKEFYRTILEAPMIRVRIYHQPSKDLLVDIRSRELDFKLVVNEALACMRHPCLHFSVDLSQPNGDPFPLEKVTP